MQYARTEMILNTHNPDFAKAIKLVYRFEEVQKLKFSVYDLDNETRTLEDDDFLGQLECTLGEVRRIKLGSANDHFCCYTVYRLLVLVSLPTLSLGKMAKRRQELLL